MRSSKSERDLTRLEAGLDQMKETIGRFVARALAANLELTLANHSTGPHALDVQSDDPRATEIIQSTLAFLHYQLVDRQRK